VRALLLPVGADRYALDLTRICEVVRGPELTSLPGAPPGVLGVMNLRGEVVPVLDSAALLGTGRLARADYAVVADTDAGLAALAADGEPATVELAEAAGPSELEAGIARFAVGDAVVALLDLDALLAPERIGAA
jgi:chemotaxis signal transduction protein